MTEPTSAPGSAPGYARADPSRSEPAMVMVAMAIGTMLRSWRSTIAYSPTNTAPISPALNAHVARCCVEAVFASKPTTTPASDGCDDEQRHDGPRQHRRDRTDAGGEPWQVGRCAAIGRPHRAIARAECRAQRAGHRSDRPDGERDGDGAVTGQRSNRRPRWHGAGDDTHGRRHDERSDDRRADQDEHLQLKRLRGSELRQDSRKVVGGREAAGDENMIA